MEPKKSDRILEGRVQQVGPYHGDLEIVIKDKYNDVYLLYLSGEPSTLDSLSEVINNHQEIYGKLRVEVIRKIDSTKETSALDRLLSSFEELSKIEDFFDLTFPGRFRSF